MKAQAKGARNSAEQAMEQLSALREELAAKEKAATAGQTLECVPACPCLTEDSIPLHVLHTYIPSQNAAGALWLLNPWECTAAMCAACFRHH
jgi:hypothetical protein